MYTLKTPPTTQVTNPALRYTKRYFPAPRRIKINPSTLHPILCQAQKKTDATTQIPSTQQKPLQTAALIGLFVSCGVANRVTYKMTLVPMREYIFFMAQILSLVYLVAYVPILVVRYRLGIVTREMLAIPKLRFVFIGVGEAVASLLQLICTARLPGIILPILSQLMIIYQMVLSIAMLKRTYSANQYFGVGFVVIGSILAATATSSASSVGKNIVPWMLLMNVVFIIYAVVFALKEQIFEDSRIRLKGQQLDVFVVNSFGSLAQVLGTICLFPYLLKAKEMAIKDLPRYVMDSVSCFCGVNPSAGVNCSGAPLLPLLYIGCNLVLNVTGLFLIRKLGVVVTSLSASLIVPLTIAVFTVDLPYLGSGPALSAKFLTGCVVLVAGMLIYSLKDIAQLKRQQRRSSSNAS